MWHWWQKYTQSWLCVQCLCKLPLTRQKHPSCELHSRVSTKTEEKSIWDGKQNFSLVQESHLSNITSGTLEMETRRLKKNESEYCPNLPSARFLHLITNHWDVLITLCIRILNQPITQAAARLWENLMDSTGPRNLAPVDCGPVDGFGPRNRPTLRFFSPVFNPRSKFLEKLVWIFQTNGLMFFFWRHKWTVSLYLPSTGELALFSNTLTLIVIY